MANNILELLPEIHEKIYSYCDGTDLINLACCSSTFNNALKHILWDKIKIPWSILGNKWKQWFFFVDLSMKDRLQNLQYTSSLHFYADGSENVADEKQWENICTNYKRILEYCDPKKLVMVHFEGVIHDEQIKLTCDLLDKLEEISLKSCQDLSGVSWQSLFSLKHLQKLSIAKCNVPGETMVTISKNTMLQELHLQQFAPTTSWNFSCISEFLELRKLTFCYNRGINDYNNLRNLHNLVELDLKFTSTGSEGLSIICNNLLQLKVLNLRGCSSIGDEGFMDVPKLKSLEVFDISGCNISDKGLLHVSSTQTLKKLDISHCYSITDTGFSHLNNLTSLRELCLAWSRKLTDGSLSIISHLQIVGKLDLNRCGNISDLGLSDISTMTSIHELSLNGCVLVSDSGITDLCKLVWLKSLDIGYSCVSDAGLKELGALLYLVDLDITGCINVSDTGIVYLGSFISLRRLNLSHTNVTNDGLSHLEKLVYLKELNLSSCCSLTDTSLLHINKMLSLESLCIGLTKFTDTGLENLRTLRSLKKLECRNGDITKEGVKKLDVCTLLKQVDF